jgi:Nucleoside 2-deoxyribosyltransferase
MATSSSSLMVEGESSMWRPGDQSWSEAQLIPLGFSGNRCLDGTLWEHAVMQIYLAGPLFTGGDQLFLEEVATRIEALGFDCFVPHRQRIDPLNAQTVFAKDFAGLTASHAVVAWLDGTNIDDGTATEIGIFHQLIRQDPTRYRTIIGLATDLRLKRAKDSGTRDGGLNLFVSGAILDVGQICWSVDDALDALTQLARH